MPGRSPNRDEIPTVTTEASEIIAIVGAGQMGLVLADALAGRMHQVRLWCRDDEKARELAETRESARLPGFSLPNVVEVTSNDLEALDGATIVVCAVPTQFIRPVFTHLRWDVRKDAIIVSTSKGIEIDTLLCPTQIIADVLGDLKRHPDHPMCALSGPAIATELARRQPATLVAASVDEMIAARVQDLFTTSWLRVYRLHDMPGVELAGATKNVIALAAGMIDGMGIGLNAKSALLARGLAEIARLGTALGANTETFFGIAGVGDLATTCFSPDGRNRTCGERLGRGETLEQITASTDSVVEGIATTRAVHALAQSTGIDMPIMQAVHAILFESLAPRKAIDRLMQRDLKPERIG